MPPLLYILATEYGIAAVKISNNVGYHGYMAGRGIKKKERKRKAMLMISRVDLIDTMIEQ